MKLFCIGLCLGILLPTILCATDTEPPTEVGPSTDLPTTELELPTVLPATDLPTTDLPTTDVKKEATSETIATIEVTETTVEDAEVTSDKPEETTTDADEEPGLSWLTQVFSSLKDKLTTADVADQVGAIINKVVNPLKTKSGDKDGDDADIVDQAISFLGNLPSISDVLGKLNSAEDVVNNVETKFEALIGYLPEAWVKPVKDFVNATIDEPLNGGFLEPLGLVTDQLEGVKSTIARVDNALWWFNRASIAFVISAVIVFAFKVHIGYNVLGWLLGHKIKAVSHLVGLLTETGYNSVGWLLGETGPVQKRRDEVSRFYHQNPQRSISRTAPILNSISESYAKYEDDSASHSPYPYSDYTA